MGLLTKAEATALVKKTFGKAFKGAMAIPAFGAADVLDIVETPLRDSTLVDVYVGKLWTGPARTTGGGVSMFQFQCVGRRWIRRSGLFQVAKGTSAADRQQALVELRNLRAKTLPKPTAAAPARAKTSAVPISETKGAGKLAALKVVGKRAVKPNSAKDLATAEQKLGTRLPAGYRTLLGALGQGVLGGLVRIFPPGKLVKQRTAWRAAVERYWFWGATPVAQADALAGYQLGDTENGDQLVVLPDDPDAIVLLPRNSETSRVLGRGLATALADYLKRDRTFQPF